jgi:DNA-binding transcriptional MerR regulator
MTSITIGQLGRRVGLRPSAIRYYEAQGILGSPDRSAKGYRLYGPEAIIRLQFIRRSKELGFSLDEVRQLIERSRNQPPCALSRSDRASSCRGRERALPVAFAARSAQKVAASATSGASLRRSVSADRGQPVGGANPGSCPSWDTTWHIVAKFKLGPYQRPGGARRTGRGQERELEIRKDLYRRKDPNIRYAIVFPVAKRSFFS